MSSSASILSFHHRELGRLSTSHRPVPTLLSRPVQDPSESSGEETDLPQPEGSSLTPQRLPASYPTQLSNRGDTTSHCYFTVSPRLAQFHVCVPSHAQLTSAPSVLTENSLLAPQESASLSIAQCQQYCLAHSKSSISSLACPTKSMHLSYTVLKTQKCTGQN